MSEVYMIFAYDSYYGSFLVDEFWKVFTTKEAAQEAFNVYGWKDFAGVPYKLCDDYEEYCSYYIKTLEVI